VVSWVVSGAALLLAFIALALVRRLARRCDVLTKSYWDLRYEYTRLRSQVARLDPGDAPPAEPAEEQSLPSVSFVPLSTIRKKDK
jgi:hypothetical protein